MNDQSRPNENTASPAAKINFPSTAPKICHNPNCGFQTREALRDCPKCGRPIWTTNQFRLISSLLIFCGLFFILLGSGLLYALAPIDGNSSGTRFTGSEGQKMFILGIFAVMIAFGLSVLAAGLWQVVFGRANGRLIYIMFTALMIGLVIVGFGRLILTLLAN